MLAYSFVYTLNQHMGHHLAWNIAKESGMLAGEKYTYNYLDLEDTPEDFVNKLSELRGKTGLVGWRIDSYDIETGHIVVKINPSTGCPGRCKSVQSLQCGYMEGFILGVLENYINCKYSVYAECSPCGQDGLRYAENTPCIFKMYPKNYKKPDQI